MNFHVNLEIILVALTLFSGLVILVYFLKNKLAKSSESNQENEDKEIPLLLDYSKSFFPVLLIVIVTRSFIAEPFRIPSGSMIPTLEIGDFVLVKKYAYGVKLPITHTKIIDTGKPQRGDVVVFRYPPNPKINYIKRLIGLPGDEIEWTHDKKLRINGKPAAYQGLENYSLRNDFGSMVPAPQYNEMLPKTVADHKVIVFPGFEKSTKWTVPEGHYFVMGDNRDNSSDSRVWGFVPDANLVGKASLIWLHWDWSSEGDGFKFSRIGTSI